MKIDTLALFMVWLLLHSKKDYDYVLPLYDAFVEFSNNGGKKNG